MSACISRRPTCPWRDMSRLNIVAVSAMFTTTVPSSTAIVPGEGWRIAATASVTVLWLPRHRDDRGRKQHQAQTGRHPPQPPGHPRRLRFSDRLGHRLSAALVPPLLAEGATPVIAAIRVCIVVATRAMCSSPLRCAAAIIGSSGPVRQYRRYERRTSRVSSCWARAYSGSRGGERGIDPSIQERDTGSSF